jgi:GDP-D-mannose dehydratase
VLTRLLRTALGTLRLLDAIRTCGLTKSVRFYQVCMLPSLF